MISDQQTALVKATVPALRQHGETITRTFYGNMFAAHPELYNIFNPANQKNGGQPRSLSAAVLAYAEHIDNPGVLGGMLQRIESKHVSLEVKPEHYPIVGKYLLGAIEEVLGEAATPQILDAWGAAYGQLADIMIGQERALVHASASQTGGWEGFKPFRVDRKVSENEVMNSFYLVPEDGQPLPPFLPGQYLSVKVHPEGYPFDQIRQYSLSSATNGSYYRISVQRESTPADKIGGPEGLVSNFLDEGVNEGDLLSVHMPGGDFVLREGDSPVVLLSGGAGITAMLCMLEHLASPQGGSRDVLFVHATRGRERHAFNEQVRTLASKRSRIKVVVLYEEIGPDDKLGQHHDLVGRVTGEILTNHLQGTPADFYFCGPPGFMSAMETTLEQLGVPTQRRHSEVFGPDPSFATHEIPNLEGH
ncbi:NO-inducible flavohemoprotein [soil metagenome]